MYATQKPAAAAATQAKSTNGANQAPVLFAVPAPSSVGKGLLCLCRKVYWTNGSLMHCAYAPVTKDEASKLLRDPSVISILSNPVSGSNLLTVAQNGAIIGVQQTVGYLQNSPTSSVCTERLALKQCVKKTAAASAASAPNEAENAPSKAAALPQPTNTPSSAQKRTSVVAPTITSTPMLPKINAVFTLAPTGITAATINEATKVEACKETSEPKTKVVPVESTKVLPKKITQKANLLTAELPKLPSKESTKQSNVLSDVQNKVQDNQDGQTKRDVQTTGIKRKSDITKTEESIDKKRKITTTPPAGALKVKFTWNKKWSVQDEKTDSKNEANTTKSKIASNSQPPVECPVPEIQQPQTQSTDLAQTAILEKQPAVEVHTSWGNIVVNNPEAFQFAYDTRSKLVAINGTVPHLATQKKLSGDDLKRLGCSSSCSFLQSMTSTKKKEQAAKTRHQKKKLAASAPSLNALTRNPDFNHIPTGDKVAYLKEVLRMQRAALGISV